MQILDFIVRAVFIPGTLLVIVIKFIPEAIKDVKEWKSLFTTEPKRKTVKIPASAKAQYSNSFSERLISD